MPKILVVDDHYVVRHGIKEMLAQAIPHAEFGEAENAAEAHEQLRNDGWCLVVLDITMPGRSGLDVLSELHHSHPKLPVLVFSMHSEDELGIRCFQSGAWGYLNKQSQPAEVASVVQVLMGGRKYVSPALTDRVVGSIGKDASRAPHETLSNREHEVMTKLAAGKTASEVAAEMLLSVKTISTYRARIMQKMHMKTNAQLMKYAVDNQLTA